MVSVYPLVICNIAMENGHLSHLLIGKSTISMTMFSSYVSLPESIMTYHYIL